MTPTLSPAYEGRYTSFVVRLIEGPTTFSARIFGVSRRFLQPSGFFMQLSLMQPEEGFIMYQKNFGLASHCQLRGIPDPEKPVAVERAFTPPNIFAEAATAGLLNFETGSPTPSLFVSTPIMHQPSLSQVMGSR